MHIIIWNTIEIKALSYSDLQIFKYLLKKNIKQILYFCNKLHQGRFMNFSISELFSYFGGFLGLLLVIVIFTRMKGKTLIKLSLSFILIQTSLTVILGAWGYSGKMVYTPYLYRLDSPIHFLGPPAYYFFILALLNKDLKFRWIQLLNALPAVLDIVLFIPFYLSSNAEKLANYETYLENGTILLRYHYLLKTISMWIYFIAQIYIFYKYIIKDSDKKGYDKHIIYWILVFFAGQFICYGGVLVDQVTGLKLFVDPYQFSMNMVLFIVYTLVLSLIFTPRLLYGNLFYDKPPQKKYSYSSLLEDEKLRIFRSWQEFIDNEDKPFLSPKLSLPEVAEKLKTNPSRLSQVINEKSQMNFNDYLNYLRVEEAKKLLTGNDYQNLTIDAIAQKSGFNSKSPFYISFKKFTGMTPKNFVEKINKEK